MCLSSETDHLGDGRVGVAATHRVGSCVFPPLKRALAEIRAVDFIGCDAHLVPALPIFRYHPDPVGTGSAVPSDEECEVCDQPAEFKYAGGSIFGRQVDVLCLRCIADGTAAVRLARPDGPAEFTDVGWRVPDDVPARVLEEVSQRTPGFIGWQQEHWLYHCADAAAFLGPVGWEDVAQLPDAIESLRADLDELGVGQDDADWQIKMMRRDGDLTGYLFRCLHCGAHLAYSDAS